jgi:hypothetical protein
MSWLSNWMSPGRGYDAAADQIRQAQQQAQQFQQPFMQPGAQAGGVLSEQLQRLMDPAALQSEWAKGYETSPYAQQLMGKATEEGMGAASAMGLMGSTPAIQAVQAGATNIMDRDRQQYLQDLMNKYTTGLGLGQNLFQTGAGMAGQMGQQAMQAGEDLAQLGLGRQQAGAGMFGNLLGLGSQLGLGWLTGGFGQGGYGRGAFQPTWR